MGSRCACLHTELSQVAQRHLAVMWLRLIQTAFEIHTVELHAWAFDMKSLKEGQNYSGGRLSSSKRIVTNFENVLKIPNSKETVP